MNRAGIVVTGLVALALIVGGVILLGEDDKQVAELRNAQNEANENNSTQASDVDESTINYTGSLFTPSQVTVNPGASITIKNTSSHSLEFQSDPHPAHTENFELNAGAIATGDSKTFTVTAKGSWGYHNHLDSSQTGTIVVR